MTDDALQSSERRFDWRVWRRILGHARPYRNLLVVMAVAALMLAATESGFTLAASKLIDAAVAGESLVPAVIALAVLSVAFAAAVWLFIDKAGSLSSRLSHDIRHGAFARLQEFDYGWFDRHPVGWLMARMTTDCDRLAQITAWGSVDILWGMVMMTSLSGVMLILDWRMGLAALSVTPVLALVSVFFQKRLLTSSRRIRGMNSHITASFNESLNGVRTTKSLTREEASLEEFSTLARSMETESVKNAEQNALYLPLILALGSIGMAAVLVVGAGRVDAGLIGAGALIAFFSFVGLFFGPVEEVAARFAELQMAQAAAERIVGLLETTPDIRDSEHVVEAVAEGRRFGRPDGIANDGHPETISEIAFEGVNFAYQGGDLVLKNFSYETKAGRTVALVGPTGSGKTTLTNLLCRFRDPTAGRVTVDGIDLRDRSLEWLQSNLGIVLQHPHLFSGTVMENIRYGRLDATDDEVREAARLVQAHEFVVELEQGYGTEVGEGGGRLSAGQRQLVSFARAVLADPQIFVMDEATASVDTETEQLIQAGLKAVMAGRTCFVIAHRLSTIRDADEILYLSGGRLVERGTHDELMARGGAYRDLVRQQERSLHSGGILE